MSSSKKFKGYLAVLHRGQEEVLAREFARRLVRAPYKSQIRRRRHPRAPGVTRGRATS